MRGKYVILFVFVAISLIVISFIGFNVTKKGTYSAGTYVCCSSSTIEDWCIDADHDVCASGERRECSCRNTASSEENCGKYGLQTACPDENICETVDKGWGTCYRITGRKCTGSLAEEQKNVCSNQNRGFDGYLCSCTTCKTGYEEKNGVCVQKSSSGSTTGPSVHGAGCSDLGFYDSSVMNQAADNVDSQGSGSCDVVYTCKWYTEDACKADNKVTSCSAKTYKGSVNTGTNIFDSMTCYIPDGSSISNGCTGALLSACVATAVAQCGQKTSSGNVCNNCYSGCTHSTTKACSYTCNETPADNSGGGSGGGWNDTPSIPGKYTIRFYKDEKLIDTQTCTYDNSTKKCSAGAITSPSSDEFHLSSCGGTLVADLSKYVVTANTNFYACTTGKHTVKFYKDDKLVSTQTCDYNSNYECEKGVITNPTGDKYHLTNCNGTAVDDVSTYVINKSVNLYYCSPDNSGQIINPKTGTLAIVLVWIVGLGTLVYSLWYFRKMKLLSNKK